MHTWTRTYNLNTESHTLSPLSLEFVVAICQLATLRRCTPHDRLIFAVPRCPHRPFLILLLMFIFA